MLTGRENIYINGAILGMSRHEVNQKFDAIVKFADIGDFLDTPVKFYSSGMFVRLGFSVAVHCNPDILLVDEVLAVGDRFFRNKCFKAMDEIKNKRNAAIVFISHDLFTIEKFCDKGIFLSKGKVQSRGKICKVVQDYQLTDNKLSKKNEIRIKNLKEKSNYTKKVEIIAVEFLSEDGKVQKSFAFNEPLIIRITYKANDSVRPRFQLAMRRWDSELVSVFGPHLETSKEFNINKGKGILECRIEKIPLLKNKYYVNIGVYDRTGKVTFDFWDANAHPELFFEILPNKISAMMGQYTGLCHFGSRWSEKKL